MNIIKSNLEILPDIDMLVRVYRNQSEEYKEGEQICSEVLFKNYLDKEHRRFTAWLPRGAVNSIVSTLNEFSNNDWKVQIKNELEDTVGVLTSCRVNFDNSKEWLNLSIKLDNNISTTFVTKQNQI